MKGLSAIRSVGEKVNNYLTTRMVENTVRNMEYLSRIETDSATILSETKNDIYITNNINVYYADNSTNNYYGGRSWDV